MIAYLFPRGKEVASFFRFLLWSFYAFSISPNTFDILDIPNRFPRAYRIVFPLSITISSIPNKNPTISSMH
jgi:hypothetical protein